jgi:hypothetical protein
MPWTIGVCLLATLLPLSGQTGSSSITLRFHHLHYRVADPGAALGDTADALGGTRTILQGLGVGVRVGREYVLFDRETGRVSGANAGRPSDAFARAVAWLTRKGAVVRPASLAETAVGRALPNTLVDHVGFAADDPAAAIAALRVKPSFMNEDRALFRLASGSVVEIVRDTDRPDAWWCPMHPDVRSPGVGKCPLCAMALVPIPPPRIGEYKLDVTLLPRVGGGASGLQLVVRDPDTGEPVTRFIDVHERKLHLFILSRDLAQFAHVHPEPRQDGGFDLRHELAAGQYMIVADFLPAGGTSQLVHRAVVTRGYARPLFTPSPEIVSVPPELIVDGLRIRMEAPSPSARRETTMRFHVSDAVSGQPMTDLEPYLGAPGHLLIVNQDVTTVIHGHPEGPSTTGPIVTFTPVLPGPGRYKLWAQFQRRGAVVTAAFVIDVPQS